MLDKSKTRCYNSYIMKQTLNTTERNTLTTMVGTNAMIGQVTSLMNGFHATIEMMPRELDNGRLRLGSRRVSAFYTTRANPSDNFYYALIYTGAKSKPRYSREWQNVEYDKHFVSGKTFAEFAANFKAAFDKKFD